jgi:steroid 5-alpha reductase family enzyme
MQLIFPAIPLIVLAFMVTLFLVAIVLRNNGIVDIGWGIGFILIASAGLWLQPAPDPRQWLLWGLVLAWGIRLAVYILLRNRGHGEDWRYAQWRKDWGTNWVWRSFLQVFMLQGAIMLVVATPIWLSVGYHGGPLNVLDWIGCLVFALGLLIESLGDFQLMAFKRNPLHKGKIMTSGVWKYTRHPNYFGEALLWWGLGIIALNLPYGYWGLIGPLAINYFLIFVSGVPMLERGMEGRPGWAEYKARTSAFFPWFPKR